MQTRNSSVALPSGAALYAWLRARVTARLACRSDAHFAIGVSLIWALLYNLRFWHQMLAAMWHPTFAAVLFVASLFIVIVALHAILILLVPTRALMRAAASALFVVAALSSYFTSVYGAIMNRDMMRNVIETDPAEVGGLLSIDLLAHAVLLGVLPAILVWRVDLPATTRRMQLKGRAAFVLVALALCVAGLFASSANYAVFFRQYKPIRYSLSPAAAIASLAGLLAGEHRSEGQRALLDPAGTAQRVAAPHSKPLVLFLVIGETARAANFQLGGYARRTNPRLAALGDLVYFQHATSCATSTAISVPCMFSHLSRAQFDVADAGRYTNLLDALASAGVEVEWRDNNAGCKGVCERVGHVDYSDRPDPVLCRESYCYDEIMLTDLPARLQSLQQDTLIVFHQIGSHGPAYSERYPPRFEIFKPACRSHQLQRCSPAEVVNAYDNSIAYTDYVVSRQIALLRAAADRVDSVLIYASDHGESLGEQGVYLHGMPYTFAPRAQREVPLLIWTSPGYAARAGLRSDCLRKHAAEQVSHDNLYHTVLGAMDVRNRIYDRNLDMLSACRSASRSGHE